MSYKRPGDDIVAIKDALYVAETEKAYGVVPIAAIAESMAADRITDIKEARNTTDGMLVWIAKSKISDATLTRCDVFPNLRVQFPSKFNPDAIPFKMKVEFKAPLWLVKSKGLVANEISENAVSKSMNDLW